MPHQNVVQLLDRHLEKVTRLNDAFSSTHQHEWTPLVILNELAVQIGQVYNICYQDSAVDEPGRQFTNLGDEVADIFSQVIALADALNIDLYQVRDLPDFSVSEWPALPVLLGQLNEAVMEKHGYRFQKPRQTFASIDDFITDRILRMLVTTCQIAEQHQLDLDHELAAMVEDASGFLANFDAEKIASQGIVKQ